MNQSTPADTWRTTDRGRCKAARFPTRVPSQLADAGRTEQQGTRAGGDACPSSPPQGGDSRWFDGYAVEGPLRSHLDGLDRLVADGMFVARRKFRGSAANGLDLALRVRVYALVHAALEAERLMRVRFGVNGRTPEQVAGGMGFGSAGVVINWMRSTGTRGIRAHELVGLVAGEALCPPVRRWLAEQIGAEMGFAVAFECDAPARNGGCEAMSNGVVDLVAAVGRLGEAVRDAGLDGRIDEDDRARLRGAIRAAASELARMQAEVG